MGSGIVVLTCWRGSREHIGITQASLDSDMGWREGRVTSEVNRLSLWRCMGYP